MNNINQTVINGIIEIFIKIFDKNKISWFLGGSQRFGWNDTKSDIDFFIKPKEELNVIDIFANSGMIVREDNHIQQQYPLNSITFY